MSALFQRIEPSKKFRINVNTIARLLRIPKNLIVRVECWRYVIFVHRRDVGGQFVSYRKLQEWQNAVACQIQKCSTRQQLESLWPMIEKDEKKHKTQYKESVVPFLLKIWRKCWLALPDAFTDTNELLNQRSLP
ncbi:MAG: hypothetical protein U7123_07455 [Potamolinea sp.]